MQKLLGICLLFLAFNGLSCDICNMSVSLTPDDTKNRISLLYRHRFATKTFSTLVYTPVPNTSGSRHSGAILLPGMEDQTHTETFSVMDVRGVYNFNDRIRLIGSLPLVRNERVINNASQFVVSGLGDPFVLGKYNLVRTNFTEEEKSNHRVTLGGGIKIPLGEYDFTNNGTTAQHDIQAGTGTFDFLFSLDYILKYKKTGLMFTSNYKMNTYNQKADYMFGNTLNSTLNLFYTIKRKGIILLPYIGTYIEQGNKDIEERNYEDNSGGSLLFGATGIQVFVKSFQLDALYQHTLINKLNGSLQLDTRNRFQFGISYLINNKRNES